MEVRGQSDDSLDGLTDSSEPARDVSAQQVAVFAVESRGVLRSAGRHSLHSLEQGGGGSSAGRRREREESPDIDLERLVRPRVAQDLDRDVPIWSTEQWGGLTVDQKRHVLLAVQPPGPNPRGYTSRVEVIMAMHVTDRGFRGQVAKLCALDVFQEYSLDADVLVLVAEANATLLHHQNITAYSDAIRTGNLRQFFLSYQHSVMFSDATQKRMNEVKSVMGQCEIILAREAIRHIFDTIYQPKRDINGVYIHTYHVVMHSHDDMRSVDLATYLLNELARDKTSEVYWWARVNYPSFKQHCATLCVEVNNPTFPFLVTVMGAFAVLDAQTKEYRGVYDARRLLEAYPLHDFDPDDPAANQPRRYIGEEPRQEDHVHWEAMANIPMDEYFDNICLSALEQYEKANQLANQPALPAPPARTGEDSSELDIDEALAEEARAKQGVETAEETAEDQAESYLAEQARVAAYTERVVQHMEQAGKGDGQESGPPPIELQESYAEIASYHIHCSFDGELPVFAGQVNHLDTILDYQHVDHFSKCVVYALIGRTVLGGILDKWHMSLYVYGPPGVGKGVLLDFIMSFIDPSHIETIGDRTNDNFALADALRKHLIVFPDLKDPSSRGGGSDIWATMLKVISRDPVSERRMNTNPVTLPLSKAHTLFFSNYAAAFPNALAYMRRLAILHFNEKVQRHNTRLPQDLKNSALLIIHRCFWEYARLRQEFGDCQLYDVLPKQFKQHEEETLRKAAPFFAFMTDASYAEINPSKSAPKSDVEARFAEYIKDKNLPRYHGASYESWSIFLPSSITLDVETNMIHGLAIIRNTKPFVTFVRDANWVKMLKNVSPRVAKEKGYITSVYAMEQAFKAYCDKMGIADVDTSRFGWQVDLPDSVVYVDKENCLVGVKLVEQRGNAKQVSSMADLEGDDAGQK